MTSRKTLRTAEAMQATIDAMFAGPTRTGYQVMLSDGTIISRHASRDDARLTARDIPGAFSCPYYL